MRESSVGSLKTVHHLLRSSDSLRTRTSLSSIQSFATGAGGRPYFGPTLKPLWRYSSRLVQPQANAVARSRGTRQGREPVRLVERPGVLACIAVTPVLLPDRRVIIDPSPIIPP